MRRELNRMLFQSQNEKTQKNTLDKLCCLALSQLFFVDEEGKERKRVNKLFRSQPVNWQLHVNRMDLKERGSNVVLNKSGRMSKVRVDEKSQHLTQCNKISQNCMLLET